jgi:hypothetical protein
MSRILKLLFMAVLLIGLVTSSVWAGTIAVTLTNGTIDNSSIRVSLEAATNSRAITFNGTSTGAGSGNGINPAIKFTPTASIGSAASLNITLTNLAFNGSQVNVCQLTNATNLVDNASPIAYGTPAANATTATFTLLNSLGSGNALFLTTNSPTTSAPYCADNATDNGTLALVTQPMTSAGMAKIQYTIQNAAGSTIDTGNAVNIGNYMRQFSTTYAANNSSIDYLNTPANGTTFVANNAYSLAASANIASATTDKNLASYGALSSATLSLTDTQNWQGMSRVWADTSAACNGNAAGNASNNAAANTVGGTINLAISSAAFNGSGAATYTGFVCLKSLGNAALNPRSITGAFSLSGTGLNTFTDTAVTLMTLASNGYQGIIPYVSVDPLYTTICFVNNGGTAAAAITADVMSSESVASTTALTGLSAGSVAAKATVRLDIGSTITPYTLSGTTETAGTATTMSTLSSVDRYSLRINVAGNPSTITVNCVQKDPAGAKRAVPVLTQTGTSYYQN